MGYHNGKNKARIGGVLHPARLAVFFCLVGMFLYAYADSGKYNKIVVLIHWKLNNDHHLYILPVQFRYH